MFCNGLPCPVLNFPSVPDKIHWDCLSTDVEVNDPITHIEDGKSHRKEHAGDLVNGAWMLQELDKTALLLWWACLKHWLALTNEWARKLSVDIFSRLAVVGCMKLLWKKKLAVKLMISYCQIILESNESRKDSERRLTEPIGSGRSRVKPLRLELVPETATLSLESCGTPSAALLFCLLLYLSLKKLTAAYSISDPKTMMKQVTR